MKTGKNDYKVYNKTYLLRKRYKIDFCNEKLSQEGREREEIERDNERMRKKEQIGEKLD